MKKFKTENYFTQRDNKDKKNYSLGKKFKSNEANKKYKRRFKK